LNTQEIMDLALEMAGLEKPPADTGIIVPAEDVKKVMFGIDIDTADLLMAREFGVDLVIGHHPITGSPAVSLHKVVMERHVERMQQVGIPKSKIQKLLKDRVGELDRGAHPRNYAKTGQAAKLLGMPLMNIHNPLDLVTENRVQEHLDSRLDEDSTVADVIAALEELPEYGEGPAGPVIRCGSSDDYAGKVFVSMAAGTNGGPDVMTAYFDAGVGTLVLMHIPENALKAVKEQGYGNIVIAGHMRSDSIGINMFIAELEKRGIEVIRMGGIIEG